MQNQIIREYKKSDLWRCTFIVWRALGFKCAKMAYKDFKNPDTRSWSYEKLFVYLSASGIPVGICGLYAPPRFQKGAVSLHWFAVDPKFQRFGIGSRLLDRVEKESITNGYTTLVVECDIAVTSYATTFYKRNGFKVSNNKIWAKWQEWPNQCRVLKKNLVK